MSKIWLTRPYHPEKVGYLSKSAGIDPVLAQIFLGRGISSPEEVQKFLNPTLLDLRPPQDLPGCADVAQKLWDAIKAGRKITVYGDYDVDGMTGTAILNKAINLLGGNVNFYVPNRLDEGYGLNNDAISSLANDGTQLIITVDCGISSCEEAETAKNLGIELLITDHHMPGPVLPDVSAIAHPQLVQYEGGLYSPNSERILGLSEEERKKLIEYPFPDFCGATVGLKVAWKLGTLDSGSDKVSPRFRNFLFQAIGLATLGTIADVVPLLDENRALVSYGLEKSLIDDAPIGLEELYRIAKIDKNKRITSDTIGFYIAPRLNAAGRLGQAQLGIELLLTEKPDRAKELAEYINGLNESRQKKEREILKEATRQIAEEYDENDDSAFVLDCSDWHPGIIGIISGRLSEQHHKPVIMISRDVMGQKPATGSARSVPGFNLYNALESCKKYLVRFGGHASAAGLGIMDDQIDAFRAAFCDYVKNNIPEEMKSPEILVDGEFNLGARIETVYNIEKMGPFGSGNPRPIMYSKMVYLSEEPKTMGADNRHFCGTFQQNGMSSPLRAISFGNGRWVEEMSVHGAGPFDILFHVTLNTFAGRTNVELNLIDWQPSE